MEDQNNKKGYDDFFGSNGSNGSDETERSSSEERHGERETEQQAKPSYYYTYGPLNGERQPSQPQQVSSYMPPGELRVEEHGPAAAQPPQLRSFTTSGSGKGAFQVREKRGGSFKSMFASFLAGVLVVGGLMYTADVQNWFTPTAESVLPAQSESSGTGSAASAGSSGASTIAARPDNIADLFEKASPAVIKIETYVRASRSNGGGLLDDPFFRQFFGDNYPGVTEQQEPQGQMQQSGIGTGFFFDSTGYILTNQHVIGDSDEIRVTVQGYDEPFTAKLLGSSYELDLAVIKIEGEKEFPTLPLGSSDDIEIGDWVVAIGNPYGFDHTITAGVLSAKERPIDIQDANGERNYKHLLQTDASINPGNSGGPLLNVNGEVIGINTAVSSQAQGIGFAIPTSTINEVLDSLKNNTEVPKEPAPFIGAELGEMTEQFAQQLGIEKAEGSLVRSVYYNSPAYLAGLKQYDVIVGVEGKNMNTTTELIKEIQSRKVGDEVEFNIIRQGQNMSLTVTIGDKNEFGLE
ncbi:trypsin-like peptidase domain-containing protein [Paenibacillus sp. PL2-23]|uniref:S1C family serine protease n=1 Tax=Paenibacillus sp. PL2-23 TaxID=2100729 RepID=UPI0030FB2B50